MVAEVERIYVKNKINQDNPVLYKHTRQPPPHIHPQLQQLGLHTKKRTYKQPLKMNCSVAFFFFFLQLFDVPIPNVLEAT